MPYKTEHAARIKQPKDSARYWSKQIDNTMRIILMDGNVQAIRFKADYWTSAQAKAWLKKNGWKVIKFESAIGDNPMECAVHEDLTITKFKQHYGVRSASTIMQEAALIIDEVTTDKRSLNIVSLLRELAEDLEEALENS